jgi:hypothetical protein
MQSVGSAARDLASPKTPKPSDSVPEIQGSTDLIEQRIQEKLWETLVSLPFRSYNIRHFRSSLTYKRVL